MKNNILVVDDEIDILELIKHFLEKKKYTIFTAESSKDALALLKRENIQVMFIDMYLKSPKNTEGMDGLELCREIRKTNPIAQIFSITGYSNLLELSECRGAGFDDYFVKPLDLDLLEKTVVYAFKRIDRWTQQGIITKQP